MTLPGIGMVEVEKTTYPKANHALKSIDESEVVEAMEDGGASLEQAAAATENGQDQVPEDFYVIFIPKANDKRKSTTKRPKGLAQKGRSISLSHAKSQEEDETTLSTRLLENGCSELRRTQSGRQSGDQGLNGSARAERPIFNGRDRKRANRLWSLPQLSSRNLNHKTESLLPHTSTEHPVNLEGLQETPV